jgi:hypothetical protein
MFSDCQSWLPQSEDARSALYLAMTTLIERLASSSFQRLPRLQELKISGFKGSYYSFQSVRINVSADLLTLFTL